MRSLTNAISSTTVPAAVRSGAADHVVVGCHALAMVLLVVTATRFLVRPGRDGHEGRLLAAVSLLLAGVQLDEISHPFVAAAELSTTCMLRVVAFGLLLTLALKRSRRAQAHSIEAAVGQERQRIARDLHDGLAQDLAFIVAYGQRLQSDFGPEHPLMVAASRALAVSRGALVDLSASTEDSTGAALRQVADELSRRFEVEVAVVVEDDGVATDDVGLDVGSRGEIVRIAREAVVNAVQHGGAHRVEISLVRRGREVTLRVRDDGCGLGPEGLQRRHGFGVPTMRARAESLGGRLTAAAGSLGGTELAVIVDG